MKPRRLSIAQHICRPLPPILAQTVRSWIYSYEAAQQDAFQCTIPAQTGARLTGTTADFHFYPFCVHGYYEWRNVAVALALVKAGEVILEIGANVGTETVSFADLVGPQGQVHAFEPLPLNVAYLRQASILAPHANIVIHPYALSRQPGRLRFVIPPAHSSGMGHLWQPVEQNATETLEVEVVTLDSLSKTIGPAKLIFMDTEGEEINILLGGQEYLQTHRPHLVLEASPKLLQRTGHNLGALYQTLLKLDYSIYRITRLGLAAVDRPITRSAENWVCLSKNARELAARIRRYIRCCALLPCLFGLNPLARAR